MHKPIRILLADDHALVRESLKYLFSHAEDMVVAAEAINGSEVLAALQRDSFDVALLDLSMPAPSGPELVGLVCNQPGAPPVLVLSMHDDPVIVQRSLSKGAAGYLTKDNHPDILLAAIRKIASGGRYLDPVLAQTMAFEISRGEAKQAAHEKLSEREKQIFSLLAKGSSVNEIAVLLCISNKTVSTHKARLMEKMAFACNADLVKYALQHRLVD